MSSSIREKTLKSDEVDLSNFWTGGVSFGLGTGKSSWFLGNIQREGKSQGYKIGCLLESLDEATVDKDKSFKRWDNRCSCSWILSKSFPALDFSKRSSSLGLGDFGGSIEAVICFLMIAFGGFGWDFLDIFPTCCIIITH